MADTSFKWAGDGDAPTEVSVTVRGGESVSLKVSRNAIHVPDDDPGLVAHFQRDENWTEGKPSSSPAGGEG